MRSPAESKDLLLAIPVKWVGNLKSQIQREIPIPATIEL